MPTLLDADALGTLGVRILGAAHYAQIGYSVGSAGDFNNDGIDDFLFVGPGPDGRGVTYVIYGREGGVGPIDLAMLTAQQGVAIIGPTGSNGANSVASAAGDVNGDGYADIVVGAQRDPVDNSPFGGRAYVVYGSANAGTTIDAGTMTAAQGATFRLMPNFNDSLGNAVSGVGDVNGDGLDDIMIAAEDFGSYQGRAYVLYGQLGGMANINLVTLSTQQGFSISGTLENGFAGLAVTGLGDVNGDGLDDFALSVPFEGPDQDGATYVYYGKAGGLPNIDVGTVAAADGFAIRGSAIRLMGWSISEAGDVNGDELQDIILSNGNFGGSFEAYVVFGQATGAGTVDLATLAPDRGFRILPGATSATGGTVAAAGDVNGDGYGDIMVGVIAPNSSGSAYVIYGSATIGTVTLGIADGLTVSSAIADALFGSALSSAGDVNADGVDDILVGGWRGNNGGYARGATYLVYGTIPTGTVNLVGTGRGETLAGSNAIDTILGNDGDDRLFGNSGADLLNGGAGNDVLRGGAGADSMAGGVGDDTYDIDAQDTIIENAGEGIDTVRTTLTVFTLGIHFENLDFVGAGSFTGTGNAAANTINGGIGADVLDGLGGADRLVGGAGADSYFIDNGADIVVENANEGDDSVYAGLNGYALAANVERLYLAAGITAGSGNGLANSLFGNGVANVLNGGGGNDVLVGYDGDDSLNGGTGDDVMAGGSGDDIYFVDSTADEVIENAGEGRDSIYTAISFGLGGGSFVESLIADPAGSTAAIYLTGNGIDNSLYGNAGVNILNGGGGNDVLVANAGDDSLDGGTGNDVLAGGLGNDVYVVDSVNDEIVEYAGEGRDSVYTAISYGLGSGTSIELVFATGSGNINLTGATLDDTIQGNSGNNVLAGAAGNDVLVGNAGNDVLDGGTGNDVLAGGAGDDIYVVDSTGDEIVENAGQGTDSVYASVSYGLGSGASIERLFADTTAAINLTGNAIANMIQGNAAGNILGGGGGDDTIFAFAGVDSLNGGTGNDTLYGGADDDIYFVDSAGDLVVENADEGTDTVYASTSFALNSGTSVERLVADPVVGSVAAINLTGNELANSIYANDANNLLSGGGGNDTLFGYRGNDTLDGGTGNDTLLGGEGDDTYFVDSIFDQVIENAQEGFDTVFTTVSYSADAERLAVLDRFSTYAVNLQGSGRLDGNDGANVLTSSTVGYFLYGYGGDDRLDGWRGTNTLVGGAGNDTYVATRSNAIVELAGEGTDTVELNDNLYTLAAGVSVEIIQPSSNVINVALNYTGNEIANTINGGNLNDILIGLGGNDTLDGGAGFDQLVGGAGNDTYMISDLIDTIVEGADEGLDTVRTTLTSFTLAPGLSIEIIRPGPGVDNIAISITGNELGNDITGTSAANQLNGGDGNDRLSGLFGGDTLTGGAGIDTFFFGTPPQIGGFDTITDFTAGVDRIGLSTAAFGTLANGALPASAFVLGTAALDADDRIIYDAATGALFYDADGSGSGAAVQFATLTGAPVVTAADFVIG